MKKALYGSTSTLSPTCLTGHPFPLHMIYQGKYDGWWMDSINSLADKHLVLFTDYHLVFSALSQDTDYPKSSSLAHSTSFWFDVVFRFSFPPLLRPYLLDHVSYSHGKCVQWMMDGYISLTNKHPTPCIGCAFLVPSAYKSSRWSFTTINKHPNPCTRTQVLPLPMLVTKVNMMDHEWD